MTHEEAIAIINRYNRFTVLMQVVEETLEVEIKKYGDLIEGMKKMQKDHDNAVQFMRETFKPTDATQVSDIKEEQPVELNH